MRAKRFAVAGASDDPEKYGHTCFAALIRRGYDVVPLNPKSPTILGRTAYPNLAALPEPVESLVVVTSPAVTEKVVAEALHAGVKHIWMQSGAESAAAIAAAEKAGVNVIAGGPCLLVELAVHH
jgi:predicted CoA-binding protein